MASNGDLGNSEDLVNLAASNIERLHITSGDNALAKGDCNVIVMGRTGGGKSTVGNKLLGRPDKRLTKAERQDRMAELQTWNPASSFAVGSTMSTTKFSQMGIADLNGRIMNVVDTPGLFDTDATQTNTWVVLEIIRSLALVSGKPNVFLFVVKVERINQEEFDAFNKCKSWFGLDHTIVVFSHGENIKNDNMTFEEFADLPENKTGFLKKVLNEIKNRYVVVTKDQNEQEREIDCLQKMIDEVSEKLSKAANKKILKIAADVVNKRVQSKMQELGATEPEAVLLVRKEITACTQKALGMLAAAVAASFIILGILI